ncbi:hypothetical protein [Roseibium sediminicola]|uniref:Uncharacterized protein n=1 Tax=Roseibium sediminicola TaxID=2933272 RepID=A0ABT0GRV1_9HYPH|nr:hypothetical protein [Roseibium sp. CAU 1639]MCK7611955.1 hypothetical protein [Roseibium sp. CAU 1639]
MRYIELKTLGIDPQDLNDRLQSGAITGEQAKAEMDAKGAQLDYAAIIRDLVKAPQQGGIDLDAMRRHMRILDALDTANSLLALEDADHALLAKLVKGHKWAMADRNILTFCEDIAAAPCTDPRLIAEAAE